MRKGFTMIELIFVIVILGILAAVAIPRLAATRDDAEISKAATNIQTAVSDIGSYYTSQGAFSNTIGDMTNVPSPIMVKKETCLAWGTPNNTTGEIPVTVTATGTLCSKVWAMPGLSQLKANIAGTEGGKSANTLKFGGQGVSFEGKDTTTTGTGTGTGASTGGNG
ncbi:MULTISPECIES: type II secretion system protein [unclassified Campylobacter]|uniref:type II secretion system protein n=1 Tax=unclassified Campylobacter TaxID=2593542 RepID=UPI0022E9B532|nr:MULTISPECIES: prepilin-type N-terminal cleavage/methylation domain-containing protein [unclassified Campylobacter]MDA3054581.1 prepilin-type N-terminal cleavage/methylation domain-containing protein [Campylobacter sp. VBCF_07 NA4]MDA3060635.1 prepilin-type N-terminal cleavage/methylation domain-containing protein [Campylobacter sp. VBCF_02 NA5]MDA3070099.1 prepilin-type N-terminal cleavage/methylation domain-containing protein [Campylobacter sp. VBCF_08 NA3]